MLRRLDRWSGDLNGHGCARSLNALDGPGFAVREAAYRAATTVPVEPLQWLGLCLTLDGSYQVGWGRRRLNSGPASLIFLPAGQAYAAHISHEGSHCLTAAIDPALLRNACDTTLDVELLNTARRAPPHWLAFQLRREMELADDLSPASVAHTLVALLSELFERPGLEARGAPPPWLERVQEQIHDEFHRHHTLESLARAAGVRHVHLAREFGDASDARSATTSASDALSSAAIVSRLRWTRSPRSLSMPALPTRAISPTRFGAWSACRRACSARASSSLHGGRGCRC
ncbi:AraC-like ligand-binding domain-containing protein [Mesorhizobium sp. L-8-3]|uniref:AraC-like ligand-binding domain-containing protein n=1 Tax=Mesorhizobium sp. L-8-3 TaxID=2744522 RepID=UPI00406D4BEF